MEFIFLSYFQSLLLIISYPIYKRLYLAKTKHIVSFIQVKFRNLYAISILLFNQYKLLHFLLYHISCLIKILFVLH